MAKISDVLIIGGGIHGASLAFQLIKKNVRSIVIERKFVAAGATGRSSGLVRMHYDLEPESRLAWRSFRSLTSQCSIASEDWYTVIFD
jgi:sarcosine oxidase subunit beta